MRDSGSVTVSALAITALAALVMVVMLRTEHTALERSGLYSDAARAGAILDGAELSAITALQRDLEAAAELDHRGEAWTHIEEQNAPIADGRFWLAIEDAQGRFNINRLARGSLIDRQVFTRLASGAGLEPDAIEAAIIFMEALGPVDRIDAVSAAGLRPRDIERLRPLITALPEATSVNLNAAPEPVLSALFADPIVGRTLAARRESC